MKSSSLSLGWGLLPFVAVGTGLWLFDQALLTGFHLLVLVQWIQWPWLPLCFVALAAASWIWRWLARDRGGLLVPLATHALADPGLILAARGILP